MKNTHSNRLERWLGTEQVEKLSQKMKGWYGPPVPIANIPGRVYACGDGDFCGSIKGGYYSSLFDYTKNKLNNALKKVTRETLNTGFASLGNLINQYKNGKSQEFLINKNGNTSGGICSASLWTVGTTPVAGGTSAAPSGSSPDNTTTGGLLQNNAGNDEELYFIYSNVMVDISPTCLLMYDRYFQVNVATTITGDQTISGVPTRYQGLDENLKPAANGTFLTIHVTTALPSNTRNLTVRYIDQSGNAEEDSPTQVTVASTPISRFPFANSVGCGWYFPLNSRDSGIRSITNFNLNTSQASGALDLILGKPYVLIPCPISNVPFVLDGINSCFNLVKIERNACLAFLEIFRANNNTHNFNGILKFCSG